MEMNVLQRIDKLNQINIRISNLKDKLMRTYGLNERRKLFLELEELGWKKTELSDFT